jgi:rhamnosyltransferase
MKRIGIFCFYDKDGIVDEYIEFLLDELSHCLSRLVVIVNGEINDRGKQIFKKYTDEIHIRKNKGFDGGAYKDVLINVLGWHEVQKYDELVLCNDTFYGPFVSFESIFDKIECEKADFWGLNYYCNKVANHLQSYFLVFRRKILQGSDLIDYFDKNINILSSDITDVYGDFELGLFYYLSNLGYSFSAYTKDNPYNIFQYSDISIRQFNMPILKKKVFSPKSIMWNNAMNTLKYLSLNNNYDINLILSNINRIYNLKINKQEILEFNPNKAVVISNKYDVAKVNDNDIKSIALSGKKLYVYGLGVFSAHISTIINFYQGKVEGYIVSDDQRSMPRSKKGVKVSRVSEVDNEDNMVIIVALGKKYTQEVIPYLSKFKEVIYLW